MYDTSDNNSPSKKEKILESIQSIYLRPKPRTYSSQVKKYEESLQSSAGAQSVLDGTNESAGRQLEIYEDLGSSLRSAKYPYGL